MKTGLPSASLPFKGQVTEWTTVKWSKASMFQKSRFTELDIPFRRPVSPFQPRSHPPLYQAMKAGHEPAPIQYHRYQTEVLGWTRAAR